MKNTKLSWKTILLAIVVIAALVGIKYFFPDFFENIFSPSSPAETTDIEDDVIDEDGVYTSKEDVALYIHTYGHLPSNFITKDEAEALGWTGGGLDKYAKGKCIGGDRFGNNEGLLPKKSGRTYTECDIDTLGKSSRGAKRIVFSNDGLIYYTDDHYESFELLYGNPD
ncbi:MAG: ribonuclease [Clostridia bacterium]|nr:ribonuclease [Clostridia bacterium]